MVKFFTHMSVPFVLQLAVSGLMGPVIRLDTGRRAPVAPMTKTAQKRVFLNPRYFGKNGNTIT